MNIYLIDNDGEQECYQAMNAAQAINAAAAMFCEEAAREKYDTGEESPREYWERTCFRSCSFVGTLKNFP